MGKKRQKAKPVSVGMLLLLLYSSSILNLTGGLRTKNRRFACQCIQWNVFRYVPYAVTTASTTAATAVAVATTAVPESASAAASSTSPS